MKPENVATLKWLLGWALVIAAILYYVVTTFVGVGSAPTPNGPNF